jgi:Calcineurin-like phosphoesterase
MKGRSYLKTLLASIVVFAVFMAGASASAEPWKIGIFSDSQWTKPDDGKNPNTCAADIIKQVDRQFIAEGVKLVIAVGDTVDVGSATSIGTRALYAQDLYNAGIGFYPLRGNHEAAEGTSPDLTSGAELLHAFPQIGTGRNNITPPDITTALIPALDLANNPPAARRGRAFVVGRNFSEPKDVNDANHSVSYSFDYANARFILLDQFDLTGNYYNSTIPAQQPWIDDQLADADRPRHAFVFVHKNLLGGNHKDNMFGGPVNNTDPGDGFGVNVAALSPENQAALTAKQQGEDAFIASLAANDVRFCISGHDHHHYHSIVSAPFAPGASVHQLITQSDSSKFYTPVEPFSGNDLPVAQDLYRVGYYIVTVDGPRVTIDYYGSNASYPSAFSTTPVLEFVKRDSFGYSLNGKEFLIAQGDSYTGVLDRYHGTTARILGGTNRSEGKTNTGRPLTKAVNTGWTFRELGAEKKDHEIASNIMILWGMANGLGSDETDEYVLSMSYEAQGMSEGRVKNGSFGLATKSENGQWVNAVNMNAGGTEKFVLGPWDPSYTLGTYGVDPSTHTAWAVINYNSDFAVASFGGHEYKRHHYDGHDKHWYND